MLIIFWSPHARMHHTAVHKIEKLKMYELTRRIDTITSHFPCVAINSTPLEEELRNRNVWLKIFEFIITFIDDMCSKIFVPTEI